MRRQKALRFEEREVGISLYSVTVVGFIYFHEQAI